MRTKTPKEIKKMVIESINVPDDEWVGSQGGYSFVSGHGIGYQTIVDKFMRNWRKLAPNNYNKYGKRGSRDYEVIKTLHRKNIKVFNRVTKAMSEDEEL